MRTLTIIITFLFLSTTHTQSQVITNNRWNSLRTKADTAKRFSHNLAHHYSCNCPQLGVTIYSASYDKSNRQFAIRGVAYTSPAKRGDTTRAPWVSIFLAELSGDSLKNIRKLGETLSQKKETGGFPGRSGEFSIQFKAGPADKLYFDDMGLGLYEYNIDQIQ